MPEVKTTVIHTTEIVSGKEYPLTIKKQVGLQEIMINGELLLGERFTIFESPLGTSRCYTVAQPEVTPEQRAARIQKVREAATKAMIDQGIW